MITLKNILVATDFSEPSATALRYGRTLARTFGSTLHVLHVAEDVYGRLGGEAYFAGPPNLQANIEAAARKRLDELLVDNDLEPVPSRAIVQTADAIAPTIIQYAKDSRSDLIVVGTHGRGGFAQMIVGSVAERVVRTAPCPVLTVRSPEHEFILPDALVVSEKS
jgi:universal stress protein A